MSGSPGYPLTTVKVYTVARPDSSVQSTAADWHRQQNGVGGSRNVPQSAHRGATSRRSLAACQNGSVLGSVEILTAPAGSAVASFPCPAARAHRSRPRISPLVGSAAGPPVTSASSAPATWLTAVPRSCSTPSMMWVAPMT